MALTGKIAPVAVTGFSLCNALGSGRAVILDALSEGRSGLGPSPIALPFETAAGAVRIALPELTGDLVPWATRTARIAALMLTELEPVLARMRARWAPDRVAVIMGTSTAGADATEAAYKRYVEEGGLPPEYDFKRQHTYGATLHVVKTLAGVDGPAWMLSTACTSSAKPLASAQRLIAAGMIDAAIVGGIDTLCAMTMQGFNSLGVLSSEPCRPFAAERKGISIGEGGALLVLEREGAAVGWLESVGESSDAYHMSAPHPEGDGAEAAMRRALVQAGCEPGDVDLVNAHGTGTRLNDLAEGKAISRVLGDEVPVVSTKGFTGHTLGGAGATEAALALLALQEGWLPASLGVTPQDERITVNVRADKTSGPFRRALSNSFAFGGNNVSVLLRAP